MSRCLAAGVVLALVAPLGAAPKLKDVPVTTYYPTTVGDRWVLETKYPTATSEVTEEVTAVEKKDGAVFVTVGRVQDGKVGLLGSQVKVTDRGVFRVSQLGRVYDAPYCVLQLPPKAGAAWTSEAASEGSPGTKLKYLTGKEEDVEVPAGKFRAIRIDVEYQSGGDTGRGSLWYAPRVGLVKHENPDPDSGYVKVMKSFKPGK